MEPTDSRKLLQVDNKCLDLKKPCGKALKSLSRKVRSAWNSAVSKIESNYLKIKLTFEGLGKRQTVEDTAYIANLIGAEVKPEYAEVLKDIEFSQVSFLDYRLTTETYYDKDPVPKNIKEKLFEMSLRPQHSRNKIFEKALRNDPPLDTFSEESEHANQAARDAPIAQPENAANEIVAGEMLDLPVEGSSHKQMAAKPGVAASKPDTNAAAAAHLLARCENKKFKRSKFTAEDVAAFDRATFELLKEFTPKLCFLFDSGHFDDIAKGVKNNFNFDYCEAVVAEILARSVAYNPSLDGETIRLPVKNEQGGYELAEYKIRAYYLGDNLPAYVLECQDDEGNDLHNPWFVVRGTETSNPQTLGGERHKKGCVESVLADLIHKEGVAEGVVQHAISHGGHFENSEKKHLDKIFEGRAFNLTGHSLGGNLVNQITAFLDKDIKQTYAFSAPGVSNATGKIWDEKEVDNSKLINIQVEGDVVPSAGRRLIGTHVAFTHLNKHEDVGAVESHLQMCLTKPFKMEMVDIEAEENGLGRRFAENTRAFLSPIVKKISENVLTRFLERDLPTWFVHAEGQIVEAVQVLIP